MWSDETFGPDDRRLGMIAHLKKEVVELEEGLSRSARAPVIQDELADCMMLLLDIASHSGLSANDLLFSVSAKLVINKNRKWGSPNPDGSIEHIR